MSEQDNVLKRWLYIVSNPFSNVLQVLQDKFQNLFEEEFDQTGSPYLDDQSEELQHFLLHGSVSWVYPDGSKLQASFAHPDKTSGKATLEWTGPAGTTQIDGFFHDHKLVGNVVRTRRKDGKMVDTEYFYCKKGVQHGFYRRFGRTGVLLNFGVFLNGHPSGTWWRQLPISAFVVFHAQQQHSVAFLYPDLTNCLVGDFDVGPEEVHMNRAIHRILQNVKLDHFGILRPVFDEAASFDENDVFCFEPMDETHICQKPLQPDPYETCQVEVRESLIAGAGQGLFARKDVSANWVLAYFHGVKRSFSQPDLTSSDYSISFTDEDQTAKMLDIPDQCRDYESYRATLAHKICHSFSPNAFYATAFHPRFGRIRCVVSLKDIEAGEEITCNYKYSLTKAPQWYRDSLKSYMVEQQQKEQDSPTDP